MRFLGVGLAAAVLAYLCYMGLMYFLQDSQLFPGRDTDQALLAQLRAYHPDLTDFSLTTPDGATLSGYLLPRTLPALPPRGLRRLHRPPGGPGRGSRADPRLFQGNAEEAASFFLWSPAELSRFTLAAVNYRGYGASTGPTTEQTPKADALAVFDALRARYPGAPIAVMAAASAPGWRPTWRPTVRCPRVLVTPYDCIRAVARPRTRSARGAASAPALRRHARRGPGHGPTYF
jgi:hypothetical protein